MPSDDRVLLVTGGSRGIGAACARLAGREDYKIAVNYRDNAKAAADVVAEVEAAGARAIAIQGDMGREADVARVFETIDRELGRLTHLVYSSGVTGRASRVEALETATLREVFDINVLGA